MTAEKRKKVTKKKLIKRGIAKKKVSKKPPVKRIKKVTATKKNKDSTIGKITHYFPRVRAAVIKLSAALSTGDTVMIKGHTTEFKQNIGSMQLDHVPVNSAKKGQEVGLLVESRVRRNDTVYKI